ncbi:proline-rich protein 2-like [Tachyglossus aculeatus]|uniref:proline-rich protein 2-like n=1 Tax=Tachyglossus aculeatus TaxID=9261 RepID=UPI0018F46123|nr:proline-rich protein 2-like [Tachyglossus aculeatus]
MRLRTRAWDGGKRAARTLPNLPEPRPPQYPGLRVRTTPSPGATAAPPGGRAESPPPTPTGPRSAAVAPAPEVGPRARATWQRPRAEDGPPRAHKGTHAPVHTAVMEGKGCPTVAVRRSEVRGLRLLQGRTAELTEEERLWRPRGSYSGGAPARPRPHDEDPSALKGPPPRHRLQKGAELQPGPGKCSISPALGFWAVRRPVFQQFPGPPGRRSALLCPRSSRDPPLQTRSLRLQEGSPRPRQPPATSPGPEEGGRGRITPSLLAWEAAVTEQSSARGASRGQREKKAGPSDGPPPAGS